MDELFQLTRALVDVPSVTGSESTVADILAEFLRTMGLTPDLQQVDGDRRNVSVACGTPRVVLCTHIDTVGPFFPSREDEEFIYGRGACDAKGIVAAMAKAGAQLAADGERGFGLLFVVGEETTSDGAKATASLDWPVEAVVVGEPTGNVLASGHKGMLQARLIARGRAAHSGYPDRGISAVHELVSALTRLQEVDWGDDDSLGSGTLNVGRLSGGVAPNVIAPEASAELAIRVVDSIAQTRRRLREVVGSFDAIEIEEQGASEPIECSTVEGWEARPVSFGTDLPHLGHFGRRYLIGPGSIHDAHTDQERIRKSELSEAVGLYVDLMRALLGGER